MFSTLPTVNLKLCTFSGVNRTGNICFSSNKNRFKKTPLSLSLARCLRELLPELQIPEKESEWQLCPSHPIPLSLCWLCPSRMNKGQQATVWVAHSPLFWHVSLPPSLLACLPAFLSQTQRRGSSSGSFCESCQIPCPDLAWNPTTPDTDPVVCCQAHHTPSAFH